MAKLYTYYTWKQDAIVYWENEIDSEVEAQQSTLGYTNTQKEQMRSELKTNLNLYMDAYDPKVSAYENDQTKRDEFVGILLSIASYIISKDQVATPEVPVGTLSTLPNDDLRDLFAWWLEDLPAYSGLFNVHIAMDNTDPMAPVLEYELQQNASYGTFMTDLDSYGADDLARFNATVTESGTAQRDRAVYLLFSGTDAQVVRNDIDLNQMVLVDYHTQEILDKFNWTIKGLNG